MNSYLSRLNPAERRFVIGVVVLFFIVVNVFWVAPHFGDWTQWKRRLLAGRATLQDYKQMIAQQPRWEAELARMEGGTEVPPEDQAAQLLQTISIHAAQSGVNIIAPRQTTRTNELYYVERVQNVNLQGGEKQLVDFLKSLSDTSLIRVQSIRIYTDAPRQQLIADATLVASYKKRPGTRAVAAPAATPPATAAPDQTGRRTKQPAALPSKGTPPARGAVPPPLPPTQKKK